MKKDEFIIRVEIAGKIYPIAITRGDQSSEEMARNAAKLVHEGCLSYKTHFSKELDERDLLAMTSFQLAKEVLSLKEKNDTLPFKEKIKQLTVKLEKFLIDK